MSSLSAVMEQPVGVHIQGRVGPHVADAASRSRALVSLPTMLGGQVNLALRYSGVGQRIPTKRRNVGVTESRAVTEPQVQPQVKKAPVQRTIISPNLAKKWREVAGATNWKGMLDPLDDDLRNEIIRYGDFNQATYDTYDADKHSRYQGSCLYNKAAFLEKAGLGDSGYEVTKYLYTTTDVKSLMLRNESKDAWSRDSNWAGYVAVCTDENRIKQLGRRDIVVAWRGTQTNSEWIADAKTSVIPSSLDDRETRDGVLNPSVGMEQGFLSLYTSKNPKMRYNKKSAREQLLTELNRLIEKYDDDTLSITLVGHSLGAALAILSAYDIAESGINRHHDNAPVPSKWGQKTAEPTKTSSPADTMKVHAVPITVFTFGGPRVGNTPFVKRVEELGVKVLRIVNVNDFVPKTPGFIFGAISESMGIFDKLIEQLPWTYSHGGVELQIDNNDSPYLSPMDAPSAIGNRHNLQVHLHLLAGHQGSGIGKGNDFKFQVRRDPALVNKSCDALADKGIPASWLQVENKGLVQNEHFEYVMTDRNTEDIPIPDDDKD